MNTLNEVRQSVFKFSVLQVLMLPSKYTNEQVYASLIHLYAKNYILPINNVVRILEENNKTQLVSWWEGT